MLSSVDVLKPTFLQTRECHVFLETIKLNSSPLLLTVFQEFKLGTMYNYTNNPNSRVSSPVISASQSVHPASLRGPSPLPTPANLRFCHCLFSHAIKRLKIWVWNNELKLITELDVWLQQPKDTSLSGNCNKNGYRFSWRFMWLMYLFLCRCHFQQMDFEFAFWQMIYLFISPQKVYRNFHYRKSNKNNFI